jgi:UDP-perosamine 4-acetyltransferase
MKLHAFILSPPEPVLVNLRVINGIRCFRGSAHQPIQQILDAPRFPTFAIWSTRKTFIIALVQILSRVILSGIHSSFPEKPTHNCFMNTTESTDIEQTCIILGGGGHTRSLLSTLARLPHMKPVGILDNRPELWNTEIGGVPVLGNDSCLPELRSSGIQNIIIGIGGSHNNHPRQKLFDGVQAMGFSVLSVIHDTALITPTTRLATGVQIFAGCILCTGVTIANNVIINTGAIIEHDGQIQDHVHVAPGATLCGNVTLETGVHVGAGATLIQGITIGAWSIVGAGAVVTRDVPPHTTVVGSPARPIPRRH